MKTIAIIGGGFSGTLTAVNLARLSDHALRVVIWNVTRHRIAASIHDTITDALDCGRLKIVRGAIQKLIPDENQITVLLHGDDGNACTRSGQLVINCTGPQSRFSQTGLPLFDNLLRKGLVQSDELDMGIELDEQFAAVTAEGMPARMLYHSYRP